VNRVQRGYAPPQVFQQESRRSDTCLVAIRARIVPGHHTRGAGPFVAERARGGALMAVGGTRGGGFPMARSAQFGRRRVTQGHTQQRAVRPDCQYRDDRKCSCSKHVVLGSAWRQEERQRRRRGQGSKQDVCPQSRLVGWAIPVGFSRPVPKKSHETRAALEPAGRLPRTTVRRTPCRRCPRQHIQPRAARRLPIPYRSDWERRIERSPADGAS
jgi:hypothetical protein